jgi:ferredoxin
MLKESLLQYSKINIMAIKITDDCINCGACEPECPNSAIYEGAIDWRWQDKTKLAGHITFPDGTEADADPITRQFLMKCIILYQENVQNVKGFMKNPSVKRYAR